MNSLEYDREKQLWFANAMQAAKKMPDSFSFDTLRAKVGSSPLHPNWWGIFARKLNKLGYIRYTVGASFVASRNGGLTGMYKKG